MLGKLEFLNISTLNIFKLYDDKKYFEIRFDEGVDEGDLIYIDSVIKDSFDMTRKTKLLSPEIKKENITIDCNHSAYLASMHVVAKDQKGLFAYIAKVFDDFEVEIESAKLSSMKKVANDLFLIEKNGNFCANQDKIIESLCSKK
jgi:[protein-PII] uridylyltransferase